MFNQDEDFHPAIRNKRARIEEINLILAQPRQSGTAEGFVARLIEERLHLEEAVAQLEAERHRLQLQNADTLFRWEDLDQRLLSPKTSELAEEMHQRAGEAQRSIAYETAQSGNSAGYLPRWFSFQEILADEWAERLYAAHCETWTEQNRTISPAFIRAVRDQAIAQLFAARRSSAQHEVELRAVRISDTGNPQTSAAIGEWTRRMSRLAARWNRKLEAEAVACEYRTSRGDRGLTGGAIREYSLEPKLIAEDDPLSTRRCAVCHHYECHHDDHGCFLDKDGKRSRDPGILSRSALKKTGAECWCPKFIADFSQAAELIYESGNSETLKKGAEEAITRGDSRNARRLLNQLIIKTPSAARDFDWIKAVERSVAGLEAQNREFTNVLNQPLEPPVQPGDLAQKQSDRPRDPKSSALLSNYRSELKRAILVQITRNPCATDLEVCRGLDADGAVELPSSWKVRATDRLFVGAYSSLGQRRKVEVAISKVRADLRKNGLLDPR